jgi:extracellular factor (EF) 3-hydroxypalmitic acid methyl ester biosynthesis protein
MVQEQNSGPVDLASNTWFNHTMSSASDGHLKDSHVVFQTDKGVELRAALLWVTRHTATFEIRDIGVSPRISEKFQSLRIVYQDRTIYAGAAVVRGLASAGLTQNCEVLLSEEAWKDAASTSNSSGWEPPSRGFDTFLSEWQKLYRVLPEYKVVVADIHTFLFDLNLWLQQVEMELNQLDPSERGRHEGQFVLQLRDSVVPAIENLFSRFETVAERIPPDLVPAHRSFCKRQLHPLVLCAPFIYRTFAKPLGYAGDYEMMNMIVRNGLEGESLFAKLVNAYMLNQAPAHGVRKRVDLLSNRMIDETLRVSRLGRNAGIFSVACGPAREVQNFISHDALSERAEFCLLDFNGETLEHTRSRIDEVKRRHQRKTPVELIQDSVQSLLRRGSKAAAPEPTFDMIYCSGLYDYLSDSVCKALNTYLHDRLRPGGLMVIGNFAPNNPIRHIMEHLLEWFLIYRNSSQLTRLTPAQVSETDCRIVVEHSGTNIFMEIRKPE